MSDFFGQLWKEYSLSDSRYMTSDPFVLCMESITAVLWGPASYLTAYMIATQSAFRHPLQALVSTGQLYGDVLYYATSLFDHYFRGIAYCRPEAYYFWTYYFLMNFFWIVIPGCESPGLSDRLQNCLQTLTKGQICSSRAPLQQRRHSGHPKLRGCPRRAIS